MPTVSLVLVFNALILWTLVTVTVEAARRGGSSWKAWGRTMVRVAANPIVASIAAGIAFGLTGWKLPPLVEVPLEWVGDLAGPLALVVLGMGLAEFGLGRERRITAAITGLKLVAHPLVVWAGAALVSLPILETRALVLLASCAVGSNVYLMDRQFCVLEGAVAQTLLVSTILSALTTPLWLALVH